MKNKLHIITACIAAIACCAPVAASAAKKPSPTPSPANSPAAKTATSPAATKTTTAPAATPAGKTTTDPNKARAIPFKGMIAAVDQKAKTFTIAGKEKSRVFKITAKTVLWKTGVAATMKDVAANEEVRGSYWKMSDGSMEAKTVKLGPKTDAEKAADTKRTTKKMEMKNDSSTAPSSTPATSPKP